MAATKPDQEPSMEEILSSIRRIIAEEGTEASEDGKASDEGIDDVLELTQVVQEDGSTVDAAVAGEPAPAPVGPPAEEPDGAPEPSMASIRDDDMERLVTGATAMSAASHFSSLARAAEPDPLMGVRGGRTVEEICIVLLKPMLKDWLDANLPGIVERLVEREIRYLSRRPENE
jgi:cell pole-organizing protein PopZ